MKRISLWTVVFGMCLLCSSTAQAQTGFIPVFIDDFGTLGSSNIFQDANGTLTVDTTFFSITGRLNIGTTTPSSFPLHVVGENGILSECSSSGCTGVTGNSLGSGGGVFGSSSGGVGVLASTQTGNAVRADLVGPCSSTSFACNIFLGVIDVGTRVVRIDITGKGFFNGGTQMGGADFAESVAPLGEKNAYWPGDVLVIDPSKPRAVALAAEPYSTRVAGIYSTKPGILATPYDIDDARVANEIPLAMVGIVPCKVSTENGAIQIGDLLVTSSTPGHAMKGTERSRMLGAVVGKALEPLPSGKGVIQVLVTLQ